MYELILVEPEAGMPPVDHEFYIMQGEIYTEAAFGQHGSQEFSVEKLHVIGEIFDKVYNLDGLTNPPLEGIQTVTVAPGGAVITELKLHVPTPSWNTRWRAWSEALPAC